MDDETFPIQNYGRIPMFVAQLAYEKYAASHGTTQSLAKLAKRGGFGTGEMDKYVPDWREQAAGITAMKDDLARYREFIDAFDKWRVVKISGSPRQSETLYSALLDKREGLPD